MPSRLFRDVYLSPTEKPVLKIPSKLKEVIKLAKEEAEKRLREDQKLVRAHLYLSSVEDIGCPSMLALEGQICQGKPRAWVSFVSVTMVNIPSRAKFPE